jgi:hypothetical protein
MPGGLTGLILKCRIQGLERRVAEIGRKDYCTTVQKLPIASYDWLHPPPHYNSILRLVVTQAVHGIIYACVRLRHNLNTRSARIPTAIFIRILGGY